jgi:alpha-L-fucosidase
MRLRLLITTLFACCQFPQHAPGEEWLSPAYYSQETAEQHDARMAWWREARFGMFVHWGLYSVAEGEWNGKAAPGAAEWILNDMQIPLSQYARLVPRFNPVNFNAREWVRAARESGMKYIVVTTKHHEGFGMYRSSLTDWCVNSTPWQRDPLKELAEACEAADIKLGFYYSIMDWHHPDYVPRKPWNDLASNAPDFDKYVGFMKGQLKELLTGYGPIGVLWFDGQWENTWTYDRGADLYGFVRGLQPNLIVNNRVNTEAPLTTGQRAIGDYRTPEQTIPSAGFGPGMDWETCMTINNTWGFKKNDNDWKPARILVRNLVDCASKGGNYLLNVGPTAEGAIPKASLERLKEVGRWMTTNGEGIYGTTASPFKRPLSWGRCTVKTNSLGSILYLHVFDWPADGELLLPGLQNSASSATLLDAPENKPMRAVRSENSLLVSLPKTALDSLCPTIKLCLEGPLEIRSVALVQNPNGSIALPAGDARLHGSTFQYESGGLLDNIGYWTTPEDWVDWEFQIKRPGKFALSAELASMANGLFEVSLAGQTVRCTTPNTGSYFNFITVKLGVIEIKSEGQATLAVRPIKQGWQPMNLKAIRLDPLPRQGG